MAVFPCILVIAYRYALSCIYSLSVLVHHIEFHSFFILCGNIGSLFNGIGIISHLIETHVTLRSYDTEIIVSPPAAFIFSFFLAGKALYGNIVEPYLVTLTSIALILSTLCILERPLTSLKILSRLEYALYLLPLGSQL